MITAGCSNTEGLSFAGSRRKSLEFGFLRTGAVLITMLVAACIAPRPMQEQPHGPRLSLAIGKPLPTCRELCADAQEDCINTAQWTQLYAEKQEACAMRFQGCLVRCLPEQPREERDGGTEHGDTASEHVR